MADFFVRALGAFVFAALIAPAATAVDLSQRYPATLHYSDERPGYDWTCDASDVWRLSEFRFRMGDKLSVISGPSQVVFGHHQSNVLWAVVFPDQPGTIERASNGQGDEVTSLWLRFHPDRVAELFPNAAVIEQGDASLIAKAKRLAAYKMRASWQVGSRPIVPPVSSITLDLETTAGQRRFFSVDMDSESVRYVDAFRTRGLPTAQSIDKKTATQVFEKVWHGFDRQYAMFAIKPQVNWQRLHDEYRPLAENAKNNDALADVIATMLSQLEDLHVHVKCNGVNVPGYHRDRLLNANRNAIPNRVTAIEQAGRDLVLGRIDRDFGYMMVSGLTDPQLPEMFSDVLEQMRDTRGLILDLRFNGGGSEPLAVAIAGLFIDQPRVYSKSRYRKGPKHTDLSQWKLRECRPSGVWHYVGPVVVLQGQRTMSSAESFALMMAQCPQVTTMGAATAGSSGNPRLIDAGAGISVSIPQWIDYDPEGKPIDGVGVLPDVRIEANAGDFNADRDPLLTAAIEFLRSHDHADSESLIRRPGSALFLESPRVVSLSPSNNSREVDPVAELRIQFDQPMDPNAFNIQWQVGGFLPRGPMRYDPNTYEFVFPVTLKPNCEHQLRGGFGMSPKPIKMLDFVSATGQAAKSFPWQFNTSGLADVMQILSPKLTENQTRRQTGEPDAKLASLVEKIRQQRRERKSFVETVRTTTIEIGDSPWRQDIRKAFHQKVARFWFEHPNRFRVDASDFFDDFEFQVGGDGSRCWTVQKNSLTVCNASEINEKNVVLGDAFGVQRYESASEAIATMDLEYRGEETHGGKTCYRFRSWQTDSDSILFRDWLIDLQTMLPVRCDSSTSTMIFRNDFQYESVDQPLSPTIFQAPDDANMKHEVLEPLGQGYETRFLNARDGSDGTVSVRWGKYGPKRKSSSGLN